MARSAAYIITAIEGSQLRVPRVRTRPPGLRSRHARALHGRRAAAGRMVRQGAALPPTLSRRRARGFEEVNVILAPATPCTAAELGQVMMKLGGVGVRVGAEKAFTAADLVHRPAGGGDALAGAARPAGDRRAGRRQPLQGGRRVGRGAPSREGRRGQRAASVKSYWSADLEVRAPEVSRSRHGDRTFPRSWPRSTARLLSLREGAQHQRRRGARRAVPGTARTPCACAASASSSTATTGSPRCVPGARVVNHNLLKLWVVTYGRDLRAGDPDSAATAQPAPAGKATPGCARPTAGASSPPTSRCSANRPR